MKAAAAVSAFFATLALCASLNSSHAQTLVGNARTIALKSGESTELGDIYWVVNCRSILKAMPKVELLDAPPELSVDVTEAQVLPRRQSCAKPVHGGKLVLSAKEISDPSISRVTIRITYTNKDGDRRQSSGIFNLSLLP